MSAQPEYTSFSQSKKPWTISVRFTGLFMVIPWGVAGTF